MHSIIQNEQSQYNYMQIFLVRTGLACKLANNDIDISININLLFR